MALITVTAPGDVVGAITAIANAISEIAKAVQITSASQTDEQREAAGKLFVELTRGPIDILTKLNHLLKLDDPKT